MQAPAGAGPSPAAPVPAAAATPLDTDLGEDDRMARATRLLPNFFSALWGLVCAFVALFFSGNFFAWLSRGKYVFSPPPIALRPADGPSHSAPDKETKELLASAARNISEDKYERALAQTDDALARLSAQPAGDRNPGTQKKALGLRALVLATLKRYPDALAAFDALHRCDIWRLCTMTAKVVVGQCIRARVALLSAPLPPPPPPPPQPVLPPFFLNGRAANTYIVWPQ